MGLGRLLRDLKEVLEKNFNLKEVRFRDNLQYCGEKDIPGFSFSVRSPQQILTMDALFSQIQKEVIAGYSHKKVVCYLLSSNQQPETYREVHVRIKKARIIESEMNMKY